MRIWGLATLTTHSQLIATVVNRKQRPTSSAAGYLMILALRKTSPSSQRGQRHMPGGGNTLCEGHERKEVQQWIGNKLCPTDWGQGREFSPTHYRSASSAYTCVANRVVWLHVGRHANARRQGCTVHPCAVTAMDTYAATFMC